MRSLRRLCLAALLIATFTMPAWADGGITQTPPCPDPGVTQGPPCTALGETQCPPLTDMVLAIQSLLF